MLRVDTSFEEYWEKFSKSSKRRHGQVAVGVEQHLKDTKYNLPLKPESIY